MIYRSKGQKTVLKRLLKYAPLQIELQRGIAQDEAEHPELMEEPESSTQSMPQYTRNPAHES